MYSVACQNILYQQKTKDITVSSAFSMAEDAISSIRRKIFERSFPLKLRYKFLPNLA